MKRARQTLACQMPYNQKRHWQIQDSVFDFFESVGTAYNNGFLDHKLAVSSFSYHALLWWEAGKPYVDQERRILKGDTSIYEEFEKFAKAMEAHNEKIDQPAMEGFLHGEKHIIDFPKDPSISLGGFQNMP